VVIKEGYDEKGKKKTGWFGRGKKEKDEKSSTLSSSQYVSRPPTASSYARSRSTPTPIITTDPTATTVAEVAASAPPMNPLGEEDDEDLPPRLNSPILQNRNQICASPPTSSNSTVSSGSDSRALTPTGSHTSPTPHALPVPSTSGEDSDIPKHAGFDLDAMRKMIGQAVRERPEELQVSATAVMAELAQSDDNEFGNTKSGLMPVLPSVVAEEKSWSARDVVKSIPSREKEQENRRYGGRGELSSSSPSLAYNSPTGNEFDSPTWGPSTSSPYLPSPTYCPSPVMPPPPSSSPGLSSPSFAGGSLHYNPFAASSTASLTSNAFNNSDHYSQSHEYHNNQIGASGGARLDSGTGLSFGSADGTIMSVDGSGSSSGSRLDAWVVPGDIGRQSGTTTSGFVMNPWA